MIAAARTADRLLAEALWTLHLPAVKTARAWVDDGRIGALCHLRCDLGFHQPFDPASRLYDPALAGGALLDLGIYPLAMAWHFLGRDPSTVHAVARSAPTGVDHDFVTIFDYPEATAALSASFRCQLPNALQLVGTEGSIVLPHFWRATTCTRYRDDTPVDHYDDSRASIGLCYEAEAFGEDLIAGRRESREVPHDTTRALQRHMARLREAWTLGVSPPRS